MESSKIMLEAPKATMPFGNKGRTEEEVSLIGWSGLFSGLRQSNEA